MKKCWNKVRRTFMVATLVGLIFTSTVFATPTVDEIKNDKANAEAKLEKLEKEMTGLMTEINAIEQDLVEVGQAVIKAEKDLDEAKENEKVQYEAMKSRIVVMYENGNGSMIQKILEADSLADMLQETENVKTLHEYDRKQLQKYVATKEKIAKLKSSLEEDMEEIQKEQKRLANKKKELDYMIADLEDKVDDYEDRIQQAAINAAPNKNNNNNNTYVPPVGTGGGAAIVAEAYKYLGTPYVWGGQSASGVDCSGLVLLAHRAIGVKLAHYSGSQGSGGRAVSRAEAQPGDVVCYSGHVGIYLGGGRMIHAPEPGDVVKVVNVYGSPWFRRYW